MVKMIQLPGNHGGEGQWAAPDRISSIELKEREYDTPCLVVTTKDGAKIIIGVSEWKVGKVMRDDIAKQVNDALESDKK